MTPLLALQLADASFPTGGFAHSSGLEAAVQLGHVTSTSIGAFVSDAMTTIARSALPFSFAAFDAPGDFPAIDARCDARLVQHVARRASRTQGRALVDSAWRIFEREAIAAIRAAVREPHHAPAFGAVARALDLDRDDHARLFLHLAMRGVLSAAVRLNVVGPIEAQRLHHALLPHVDALVDRARDRSVDDVTQTTPIADLLQGAHDRLYARLFQS